MKRDLMIQFQSKSKVLSYEIKRNPNKLKKKLESQ